MFLIATIPRSLVVKKSLVIPRGVYPGPFRDSE
jgi:hypothetical protein